MVKVELDYRNDYIFEGPDGWLTRGVTDMARLLMKVAKNNSGKASPMFKKGRATFEITGMAKHDVERIINDFVVSDEPPRRKQRGITALHAPLMRCSS